MLPVIDEGVKLVLVWNTFDQYLFNRYFYVLVVFFAAAMGLFAVVDAFTQLDAFQENGEGTAGMLLQMGRYYLYQSSLIFEMVGPSLSVISVMVVLALLLKHNEFYPLLSTGVPTYRIAWPLVFGVIVVAVMLAANQEFIIPAVSHHLHGAHGKTADDAQKFAPQYDTKTWVFVAGSELLPAQRRILKPTFVLPTPSLVAEYEPELRGDYAAYIPARGKIPAGWLIKNYFPRLDFQKLTPLGRKVVIPHKNGKDLFLVSGLSFDQLQNHSTGFRYLSTRDLLYRIQHPTTHASSTRAQIMHLHTRLTRPIVSVICVFMVIPLILRKESNNPVTNILICTLMLALMLGIGHGMEFLGQTSLVRPEVAAWTPILFGGLVASWLTGTVRT